MGPGRRSSRIPAILVVLLVGMLVAGCDDDEVTVADFAGAWEATQYQATSHASAEVSIELISIGGAFTFNANDTGTFTGEVVIPEALGGPVTVPFEGAFELLSQDSVNVNFDPEIPPVLTDFGGQFELDGDTLTIIEENTTFDFDGDGVGEPARFEGTVVRK
jgi:hypothetical protein